MPPTAHWWPALPPTTPTSGPNWPKRCRPSRWGSTSPEAGGTGQRCSADSALLGRGPSSAATSWSRPSPTDPKAPPRSCTAISRGPLGCHLVERLEPSSVGAVEPGSDQAMHDGCSSGGNVQETTVPYLS